MNKSKSTILVAEDDVNYGQQLKETLESEGYAVQLVCDGKEAIKFIQERRADIGLIDLVMPGVDGMQVLEEARKTAPDIPLVMVTGFANIERVIQAVRLGAYDFIEKTGNLERILLTVHHALEKKQLKDKTQWMSDDVLTRYRMIGSSVAMKELSERIRRIAATDSTVLITGETGTGKELAAMAIHMNSVRSTKPFIRFNCAAIPDSLVESELFGYKKGAFTGATHDYHGKFLQADGGTILLDEIGAMSLTAQAKILRVLQDHEVTILGERHPCLVNVRVMAAINKDPEKLIQEGVFREDLYYRINTLHLFILPLRERKTDIPELANYFLQYFCDVNNRYLRGFAPSALQLLMQYNWPGNVRQLRTVIERLFVFVSGDEINADDVALVLNLDEIKAKKANMKLHEAKDSFEKDYITHMLLSHKWNVVDTARALGVDRTNLHKKMHKHGIFRDEK
jgi:two-component system, NtrC family, nitrogen regulation response regulator NtrX